MISSQLTDRHLPICLVALLLNIYLKSLKLLYISIIYFILVPNTSACPVPEQTLLSNSSAGGSSNLGGRCPPDSLTMPLLQKETSFTVPQTIGVHPPISHVMQGGSQIARNGRIHSARWTKFYYLAAIVGLVQGLIHEFENQLNLIIGKFTLPANMTISFL